MSSISVVLCFLKRVYDGRENHYPVAGALTSCGYEILICKQSIVPTILGNAYINLSNSSIICCSKLNQHAKVIRLANGWNMSNRSSHAFQNACSRCIKRNVRKALCPQELDCLVH